MRVNFLTLILLASAFEMKAQRADLRSVRDSLERIYLSATVAGRHIIVDQGGLKAIFNATGRPVTQFIYTNLAPGLDGNFIAQRNSQPVLIDSNERILIHFGVDRVEAAPESGGYRGYRSQGMTRIAPDGTTTDLGNGGDNGAAQTVRVFYDHRTGMQGVKNQEGRDLLPLVYRSVSAGEHGIAALRDDTAFVFDLRGKLRFSTRADDVRMQPGGVVAIRLYGLWGLKDSLGKLIAPFDLWSLDEPSGPYIKAGGKVFNKSGQVLLKGGYNSVYMQPGGWFTVDHPNYDRDEIRDPAFRPVFRPGEYPHSNFIGTRFIHLRKKYSDKIPDVYDRQARKMSTMRVESELLPDVYVVFSGQYKRRKLLRGDGFPALPAFTDVRPSGDFFVLADEGAEGRDFLESRDYYTDRREMYPPSPVKAVPKLGLLDSQLQVIVPMGAAEIRILGRALVYAYMPGDSAG